MVPPSARFPTRRAALAEEAARRALAGFGPEPVLPQLRAQTVQELLAQPGIFRKIYDMQMSIGEEEGA